MLFLSRLVALFRKSKLDRELDEEIRGHLELLQGRFEGNGMSPEEARLAAKRAFGGVAQLKELHREERSFMWLDHLKQDVGYAIRMLLQNKGWAIVAILTLALGIGPLTGLYSLFDRAFLEKLPVPNSDELVSFGRIDGGHRRELLTTLPVIEQMRSANQTLTGLLAFDRIDYPADVIARGTLSRTSVEYISGNYFSVLQLPASRGRTIQPDDDLPGSSPVAMISHQYWERVFGQSPDAIGTSITVDRKRFTIVGVWPENFMDATGGQGPSDMGRYKRLEIMLPLVHDDFQRQHWPRLIHRLSVMGRLKPNVPLAQVQANFEPIVNQDARERTRLSIRTANPGMSDVLDYWPWLHWQAWLVLATIIGFFTIPLILACTNIATFLLSRAEDRRVEIALRLAMGASPGRLIRQLLTESILLSTLGGIAGLAVTYWWNGLLGNPPFSTYGHLSVNWRAFAFVLSIAMPVGIACGLLPARAAAGNAARMMGAFGVHFSRSRSTRPRNLMVAQVALSLMGLICAGLMVRTIHNLRSDDVGFSARNMAVFTLDPSAGVTDYDGPRSAALNEQILRAAATIRGVQAVSLSDQPIFTGASPKDGVFVRGGLQSGTADWLGVHPDFFKTMEIPLKLGREFGDHGSVLQEAVVNEAFAKEFFPNSSPIGNRFGKDLKNPYVYEIVGVAADSKSSGLTANVAPTVYLHDDCCTLGKKTFEVRTVGDPIAVLPALRATLMAIDPNLPVTKLTTPSASIEENYLAGSGPVKFVLSYYAGLSTVLAMTGIFGLMSHTVARRTKEIGIRMAVGAQPGDLLRAVMRESLQLVIPGVLLGLAAALSLARILSGYLYGVNSYDPVSVLVAMALIFAVSALAGYLPARRASRVDPVIALRND